MKTFPVHAVSLSSLVSLSLAGCGVGFDYTGHPSKDSESLSDTADSSLIQETGEETGNYNIAPVITSVYATPNPVSVSGETFTVYATITDNVAVTNASVTIDALTQALTDADGDSVYESPLFSGSSFSPGIYTLNITAFDGSLVSTDSASTVEITEPDTCPYICASNICLYVDGNLEAELNTSYPEQMTAINVIRLGYGGQYFDNLSLIVDGTSYVSEDFSSTRGCFNTGTVTNWTYVTESTDNDCFFEPSFDATTSRWMTSVDVLAGSVPNFAFRSTEYDAPGVNWDFVNGGYINDGAGLNAAFSSGIDTSQNHTIVICNKTENTE